MIPSNKKKYFFSPIFCALLFFGQNALAEELSFACPDTPNCISSRTDGDHYVAALSTTGMQERVIKTRLLEILQSWPGTEITRNSGNQLEAVISSRWFGFKDDLTLVINPDSTIDIRSASRTGYYDFGANRERAEKLRAALAE